MTAHLTAGLATVACLFAAAARADDPVYSGPQPGERLTPVRVLGFSGPDAGQEVDLLGRISGKPAILVFVHEITRPALQLLRPIDLYASKLAKDGLACHFVWLTADKAQTEAFLTRAKGSLALRSPVSISLDGPEGPGNYGLNRKVALTVLVAKDNKVVANFALVQPSETDAPKVVAAVASLLGRPAPTPEELRAELGQARGGADRPAADLAEQVRRLQAEVEELRATRRRVEQLERQVDEMIDALNDVRAQIARQAGAPVPDPIRKRPDAGLDLPGRSPSDPELTALMRRMIHPANDEARVREIVEAMKRWAGDDPARKKELADFCKRVARLKYGTEAAQKALMQLAGE